MLATTSALPVHATVEITADIVIAYVSRNVLPSNDLPGLIGAVHAQVAAITVGEAEVVEAPTFTKPSEDAIAASIRPDTLVSFIDGKPYKTLKRHLRRHGLDPYAYRARYGLPADYPMVAPNYSAARSALAKAAGLGRPGAQAA